MLRKLTIKDIGKGLKDKRVLMRVDFNVSIKNGKIVDDTRIRESLHSINYAKEMGAKTITLMSHLGRPNGERNLKYSLEPVAPALQSLLGHKVDFLKDCVGQEVLDSVNKGSNGNIFLLENLRFYAAEEGAKEKEGGGKEKEKKEVIEKFRSDLTTLGDIYVNDAFGTSHRAHSSIVGIKVPLRAAGFLLQKELEFFAKVLEHPQKPLTVILGGAKLKDKIPLIRNVIEKVDRLIITGGMAYTFLKATNQMNIGKSIFDSEAAKEVGQILEKAKKRNVEIILPEDFVVVKELKEGVPSRIVNLEQGISDDELGIDVGPRTIKRFDSVISSSKTVFLNGANGVFELEVGRNGSIKLIESIVKATQNGATTVCGGGDTLTLVNKVQGANKIISHISTGGGASLELMEGKVLPGLEFLSDKSELKSLH